MVVSMRLGTRASRAVATRPPVTLWKSRSILGAVREPSHANQRLRENRLIEPETPPTDVGSRFLLGAEVVDLTGIHVQAVHDLPERRERLDRVPLLER